MLSPSTLHAPQFDGATAPPVDVALASSEACAALSAAEGGAPPPVISTASGGLACSGSHVPGAKVVGLAKLKCLHYLVRTFGVRNLLPTLLDKGAAAYLAATERFYKNWAVPLASECPPLPTSLGTPSPSHRPWCHVAGASGAPRGTRRRLRRICSRGSQPLFGRSPKAPGRRVRDAALL